MGDSANPRRWRGRPWLGRVVRIAIHAVPFVVVTAVIWRIHVALGPAPDLPTAIGRWVVLSLLSTVALLGLDRLGRRVLPLATLLQLSLIFPDEAPSRFSIALRQNTTRRLRRDLEEGTLDEHTPQQAAETLLALVAQLSAHDRLTRGHTERVRAYTDMIGGELDLTPEERSRLQWSALLHDVGKLRVPPEILNKKGKPSTREWDIIRTHPEEGWRLLKPLRPWLGEWARAARDHHEKWDGTGYPRGLAGGQISRAGRIVAISDAFDVMTSTRSYKTPMSAADARAELARSAGSHFDEELVRAFLGVGIGRLRLVMGPLSWLAQLPAIARLPIGQVPSAAMSTAAAVTVATSAALLPPAPATEERAAREVVEEESATELPIMGSEPAPSIEQPATTARPTSTTTPASTTTSTTTSSSSTSTSTTTSPVGSSTTTTTGTASTTTTGIFPPPTVTTTTTDPLAVSTTTITLPSTSLTTTTVEITTTTELPDVLAQAFLGSNGEGPASLVLPLGGLPIQVLLPNYDTNRNTDPGLTIERGNDGFLTEDPREIQIWSLQLGADYHAEGTPVLEIWAATEDFDLSTRGLLEAAMVDCDAPATNCTVLAQGSVWFAQQDFGLGFGKVTVTMPDIDVTIPAGHHIALALIVPDDSEDNLWFAFDTILHPARGYLG